jgi:hypothetical protein
VTENKAGAKRLFRKMIKLEYKILTANWKDILERFNKTSEKLHTTALNIETYKRDNRYII